MKKKRNSVLLFLALSLVLIEIWCIYLSGKVIAAPDKFSHLSIGRNYASFQRSWKYVKDVGDPWEYSPQHQGDCEDFAITFYKELSPPPLKGWVIVIPKHAVLFLHTEEGWFALDNDNFILQGENFLDLYRHLPEILEMYELPLQDEINSGDLKGTFKKVG